VHFPSRAAAASLVAGLLLLSMAVSPATAQQARTCGWHFLDEQPAPPTLTRLLDRMETLTARHQEAVDNLLRWYTACDHTAGTLLEYDVREPG
jgi:hypothetical protein